MFKNIFKKKTIVGNFSFEGLVNFISERTKLDKEKVEEVIAYENEFYELKGFHEE